MSELDILIPPARGRTLGLVTSRRLIKIVIGVAVVWVGLFVVGYWLFSSGDDGPPVEVVTIP